MPVNLPDLMIQMLAKAAQRVLASDPVSFQHLLKNQDKRIGLIISGTGIHCCFLITPDGIEGCRSDEVADVEFITGPLTLLRLAREGYDQALVNEGLLTINGDMEAGRRLARVFAMLDIDWEGLFGQYTGTLLAHHAGTQLRSLLQWRKQLHDRLWSTGGETLTEEYRLLAPVVRIEHFNRAVDTLHTDCERLSARIKRLQQVLAK